MGNREVKPVTVPYEEAVKRVTPVELRRLKEAFRRSCGGNNMSLDMFLRDVFGDGIPHVVAEQIFTAFGGNTKNLTAKDLICGLVLFTRARETNDEKIKFIFGLYADDSLQIHKEVIDNIILQTDGQIPESLSELFEYTDKVDYPTFKKWLLLYPEFSSLSNWLILDPCTSTLTVDSELPSFYQTLAGVTHLEENEIVYLESNYNRLKSTSASGRFDLELFKRLVSPPLPRQLTGSLYKAFDENMDGHIDFKEMVCGLSACCKGPEVERQKFCFRVFDLDHDGYLSKTELIGAIEASFTVLQQNEHSETVSLSSDLSTVADLLEMDAYAMAGEIMETHGSAKEGRLSRAEYLVWANMSKVTQGFSELLFEVCHIILGMKPSTREDEGRIVRGWMSRELKRGYALGQTWYILSGFWWRQWQNYVADHVVVESVEVEDTYDVVQTFSEPYERRYAEHSASQVRQMHPPKPGPINNSHLILPQQHKVPSWTNEGGVLRPRIQQGKEFEVIPELLWQALHSWYQGNIQLPRPVIIPRGEETKEPKLELYSLTVKLYKHQAAHQTPQQPVTTVAGVTGGIANLAMSVTGLQNNMTKRVLTSTSAFSHQHSLKQITDFLAQRLKVSQEDLRLWKYLNNNDLELLEGEEKIVEELEITDGQSILMEVRNLDLTWPEEILQIVKQQQSGGAKKQDTRVESGTTGLSNLGNTCFMNSAIQCVSNCQPLTLYFLHNLHLYELNRDNPLGMKGRLAQLYAKLITNLWEGTSKNLPPVELRYTLSKYAPQFTGCQQHDAQELLSFLLDGLHEDLNRVQKKPYVELKDSDGRRDEIVAKEGWDYHLLRNRSIIVDLFHGQLKSLVRCKTCSHTSVRFDPFTYLSLPLPMENSLMLEVVVLRRDGSTPVRYGVRLDSEDKYCDIREPLQKLSEIPQDLLLFIELGGPFVKTFPLDSQKIKQRIGSLQPLYAYELEQSMQQVDPVETTPNENIANEQLSNENMQNVQLPNGHLVNGKPPSANEGSHMNSKSKMNGTVPSGMNGKASGANKTLTPNGHIGKGKSSKKGHSPSSTLTRKSGSKNNSGVGVNQSATASNLMTSSIDSIQTEATKPSGLVIAMHRKMERREFYFLASQQCVPCIFGTPVILQTTTSTTHKDLYHQVWTMIKRFVTGHPVTESCNHAQDCDGSLGNEYPFTLMMAKRYGTACSRCPYYKFCRGCLIDYTDDPFNNLCEYIAIDWDPTAYYLRYQASSDIIHSSVSEVYNSDEPVNIQKCLESFTKEEELSDEELYFCSKCKQHRMATKKLEIWRLPPVLIIHLKRFQFLSNKWIKSQKFVDFPLKDFDPESYLVPRSMAQEYSCEDSPPSDTPVTVDVSAQAAGDCHSMHSSDTPKRNKTHSITSCDSLDYSQAKYDLNALSCHRGNLGGGHYVAYTRNPNGKWYEYNDSMVKDLPEASIAQNNQRNCYILFYERQGLDYHKLMPDVKDRKRDDAGLDEEFNTELSKAASCVIQ